MLSFSQRIRVHGFRKWYERELLTSHAHLVLAFLCLIGIFAAFEAFSTTQSMTDKIIDVFAVVVCLGVGLWALRRYLYLLMHAEQAANQAVCPACQAYASFHVRSENRDGHSAHVQCRRCGHEWEIHG